MRRFFRWLGGEEGWSALLLLTFLVLLPVAAFQDARWLNTGAEDLTKTAVLGAWIALLLARSRWPGIITLPGGLLLGGAWVFAAVGGALPTLETVGNRLRLLWPWLQLVWEKKPTGPDPLSPLFWEAVRQTGFLANRFVAWVNIAVNGGVSSDNLVFLLQIAVLVWLVSFLAGWGLYRWRQPLIAVLPVGVFIFVNVYLADQGLGYLVSYLACALLILLTSNVLRLQRAWERQGLDYASELPFDVGFVSSWLVLGLVLLALPLPGLSTNPVARVWWNTLGQPWSEVETTVNRLFSGVNIPNQTMGSGAKSALVLGASFDPRQETPVFMYVSTDEVVPDLREFREMGEEPQAPSHYWRGLTYDLYTGRGWQNTERALLERRADQPVGQVNPLGFISLTQYVEIIPPRVDLIYAANQPITVSRDYYLQALGAEAYASLSFRNAPLTGMRYTAVSWIPHLGEDDLRVISSLYPSWVTKRYLQLPATLPQRVIDLSKELTAQAKTPYDKALAIQTYLRKLPYDPSILLPAGDFDAVDHFLFLQKGYCDYFGTAMAVMLRTVGVPARIARGYLPGEYNWTDHRYIVKENRLHVWTEVYFPPYGWIEFEPTPGQPAIVRPPGSLLGGSPEVVEPPPVTSPSPDLLGDLGLAGQALGLLLGLGILGSLVWTLYPAWEQRLSPARYAALIYRRMGRYAAWGGLGQRPAQTPREYAATLSRGLAREPGGLRLGGWRLGAATPSPQEGEQVAQIARAYEAATYGPKPLEEDQRSRVQQAWMGIKRRLWAVALARRWAWPTRK